MNFGDKIYSVGKANHEYMLDIDPEKEMCQITFIGRNFKDQTEYRKTIENIEEYDIQKVRETFKCRICKKKEILIPSMKKL